MGGLTRTIAVSACALIVALAAAVPAVAQQRLRPNDATLVGTSGQDVFCGLAGDDVLVGMDGDDFLFGDDCGSSLSAAADSVDGGDDTLKGGEGDDGLVGDVEDDTLSGGDGDDILSGGTGDDVLNGGPDDDSLLGAAGDDELFAGAGSDRVVAGNGNDTVSVADDDQDLVNCGRGRDAVRADSTDLLRGCEEVRRKPPPRRR